MDGHPSCFFRLHQLFKCTAEPWSWNKWKQQMHIASSLLYLWGKISRSGFPLSPFYTNTRWKAVCFHLQKIIVVNYINQETSVWKKCRFCEKWSKHKEKNFADQGNIQKLLICCCSLFWDYKQEEMRKKKRRGRERERNLKDRTFFP